MPPPAIPYTEVSRLKPAPTLDTILVEDVLELEGVASNPATLRNGMLWYNTTSNALNARINGATVALGAGGGGGGSGDALTTDPLSQFAATTSAQLRGVISDETGTGALVFATSPTLVTPILGTPTSGTLTNCTGLPVATGISGLGTGIATFLATPSSANLIAAVTDETGTGALVFANTPTLVTPVLGTPTSGTLTNCTGLPVATGISGLGTGIATFLATPSSANLIAAVTDETGTGALVFANTPTLVTPILGTPTSGTLTNCTGLPVSTGISGLGTGVATFLATPTFANLNSAVSDADLALTSGTNTFTGTQTFDSVINVGLPAASSGVVLLYNDNNAFYGGILANVTDNRDYFFPDASGDVVLHSATQTLTNKTISGASNTLTNIALSSLAQSSATSGQVATWNGSAWAPATPSGGAASDTIISPSQLTADVSDWAPTGLSTCTGIRVSADGNLRCITSITAPSGGVSQRIRLFGDDTNSVIIKDQSAELGTAANRIITGGMSVMLFPGGAIDLFYDVTSTRWRVLNPHALIFTSIRFGFQILQHSFPLGPASNASGFGFNLAAAASGAGAAGSLGSADSTNVTGFYNLATGTDTTGRCSLNGSNSQFLLGNGHYYRFAARVKVSALSDATNTYTVRVGFSDSVTGDATDGVYLRYTHGTNSGNFELVLRSNSSETAVNCSASFAADTWCNLAIDITPTRVEAYKDGVLMGSTTTVTNLPTGSGRVTGVAAYIIKSAGTTSRTLSAANFAVFGYKATP